MKKSSEQKRLYWQIPESKQNLKNWNSSLELQLFAILGSGMLSGPEVLTMLILMLI
jgi:hypothetical protein